MNAVEKMHQTYKTLQWCHKSKARICCQCICEERNSFEVQYTLRLRCTCKLQAKGNTLLQTRV